MSRPALRLPGFSDGIDVSQVQRIEDPEAVRAAGFEWCIAKATEGLNYRDPAYRSHVDALSSAGLMVGAYGFARVSQGQPRAQARHLYDTATGDGRHVVRCVLDLENCPPGTPWAALREFAEEYLSELRLSGCLPVLYTMTSWTGPLGAYTLDVPVWIAQYRSTTKPWAPASEADMPPGAWEAWQYSGDGGFRVPGIPQDCDRNVLRAVDVRAWFGLE